MSNRSGLLVSYHAPQPDRDSGSRRLFHFLQFLVGEGWQMSVLAVDGVGPERDRQALGRLGISVYDGMRSQVAEILEHHTPAFALIAYWPNARRVLPELRALSPSTRIIVDSVDLHFVREARRVLRRAALAEAALTDSDGALIAAELNAYAAADSVLAVSQKEADLVNDLTCDPGLALVVPDHEDLAASSVPFGDRKGMLWMGSFQHPPNRESLAYLCREILPLIDPVVLKKHPVRVVGNAMDDSVRAIAAGVPHVEMVGWVPAIEPYLERSAISVVPLLHGAGTKRKVIQALAIGTPTVATSIGAEGLGLRHGEDILIADDAGSFAAATIELLTDGDLWHRLAANGRQRVNRTHGAAAKKSFLDALEMSLARTPKPAPSWSGTVEPHVTALQTAARQPDWAGISVPRAPAPGRTRAKGAELLRRLPLPLPERLALNPLFDADWYKARHSELQGGARLAYRHYRSVGVRAGADPNPFFDTDWYLERNPDVVARGLDPLDHYLRFGGFEGRDPGPLFRSAWYLERNPDVAASGVNPLLHYLRFGQAEGRLPAPPVGTGDTAPLGVAQPSPNGDEPGGAATGGAATGGYAPADVRLIAFYLPQFHPIPENDAWWGPGFTEWRSVAAADPLFAGHYQPHIPGELGFYDLRLAETRQAQADLARQHGIYGFCYYHYWFNGKRLLDRPFDEVLASGKPEFPFALCWANDPWSRRWDGREDELLQTQTYSRADDIAHIRWLLPSLADPRAITIDGRPIFLVYRARHLPEPQQTTDLWRTEVLKAGLPGIQLIAMETAWDLGWDATAVGFDAKVLFQPQFGWLMTHAAKQGAALTTGGGDELQVYDYAKVTELVETIQPVPYRRYESVFPGWDNTARVGGRAVVMHNATPESYGRWLARAVARARSQPREHQVVFLNAWNEWAEGCHLEPDRRHERAFLEATRHALGPYVRQGVSETQSPLVISR